MGSNTNRKPYRVIEPGEQVVLLTYMVGICPDGNTDEEYDEFPVNLRFALDEADEKVNDPRFPSDDLKAEILKRAVKIERREHPSTPAERKFTLGHVRFKGRKLAEAR